MLNDEIGLQAVGNGILRCIRTYVHVCVCVELAIGIKKFFFWKQVTVTGYSGVHLGGGGGGGKMPPLANLAPP